MTAEEYLKSYQEQKITPTTLKGFCDKYAELKMESLQKELSELREKDSCNQSTNANKNSIISELKSELEEAKELLNKADLMYDAFAKTINQLAKDGTAIEGFTESWQAVNEFAKCKIESFLKDK